jgi:Phage integrase family
VPLGLEWDWVDFPNRRVVWPDSKTGEISKPMSEEAYRLLSRAHVNRQSQYVCPAIFDHDAPLPKDTYCHAWARILKRAGVHHVGTHGIRHRSATDIANSGVSIKAGMAVTAHKTVTMFMRYVHPEDDRVRAAAETIAARRREVVDAGRVNRLATTTKADSEPDVKGQSCVPQIATPIYRPYRNRKGSNRDAPPGSRSAHQTRQR